MCEFRGGCAVSHETLLEKACQQEVTGFTVGLGVAGTLDVYIAVKLEEIHFAVAFEDEREIDGHIVHGNGIAVFLQVFTALQLVDILF